MEQDRGDRESDRGRPEGRFGGCGAVGNPEKAHAAHDELCRLLREGTIFRLLVEGAIEFAIFAMDPEGEILTWNSGARRLFGYREEEVLGRRGHLIFTPEDRENGVVEEEISHALRGESATDERWHLRKDGSLFFASGFMMPVRDEEGRIHGTVKVVRDLTAQRNAEEEKTFLLEQAQLARKQAEEARRAAEEANRIKDRFLATLSHELRTPLTPALLLLPELAGDVRLPEDLREEVAAIHRNVELEARLIDDLLDVHRIVSGKLRMRNAPCDLHTLAAEAAQICQAGFSGKALRMEMQLEAAHHWVHGDATRLEQVFWNLINNAFKFTPSGGRVRIHSYNPAPDLVSVEVCDTGIGIEPEAIPQLYNPFKQASAEVTRLYGGLGLGLTIAKGIVDLQRGTLAVQSEGKGKGATFTVTLPVLAEQPA